MKLRFPALLLLFVAGLARAEVAEDFDGGWADPSYAGISTYDHPGVGIWESRDALVTATGARSGSCVRLDHGGGSAPYLEFKGTDGQGLDGGIGSVSFWFRHWDGDGSEIPFALEVKVADADWTVAATGVASSTSYELFTAALDLAGDDIRLRIRPTDSPPAERLLIDDFSIGMETPGPVIGFIDAGSSFGEGDGTVQIPVALSIAGSATVKVSISGGSAIGTDDFELLTPTLEFTAEDPTAEISVALVDDALPEPAETLELTLSDPSGAMLGTAIHLLTLLDNDSPPADGERLVIVAANTTSGNQQQYEGPGDRIFQALAPDIVGIQEFSVPDAGGIRAWVDRVFGSEFHYFIEPGGESIPCGVISRYPIIASGEWDDPQVPDRDFAWASIDIPGEIDLHVISVHLHGSGGSSSRVAEAEVIVAQVQATFPAEDYIVLTGDLNTDTRNEACIGTFGAIFSDARVPVGLLGDDDTNAPRSKPYDRVMPNAALEALHSPFEFGGQSFPDGLVFDTRQWNPPPPPALATDSDAAGMQHMAVVKAYRLPAPPATETSRGTPHAWLESFGFGDDFEAADLLDPDGDGALNWQEYQAGTDPTDAGSVHRIESIGPEGGEVAVRFPTRPGRAYAIEFADIPAVSFVTPAWTPFADPARGSYVENGTSPASHTFYDDFSPLTSGHEPPGTGRFYRVRVGLP